MRAHRLGAFLALLNLSASCTQREDAEAVATDASDAGPGPADLDARSPDAADAAACEPNPFIGGRCVVPCWSASECSSGERCFFFTAGCAVGLCGPPPCGGWTAFDGGAGLDGSPETICGCDGVEFTHVEGCLARPWHNRGACAEDGGTRD